jgi:hypothetical protein
MAIAGPDAAKNQASTQGRLMHFRMTGQFALACVSAALAGCDARSPVAPNADKALFSVSGGSASYNLTSAAPSPSQVDLSWQDSSTSETGFEVHRSTTGANGTFTLLATVGANVTNYSDTGLSSATEYCYQVRAFKKTGRTRSYAPLSNTSCVTTLLAGLAAPSNANALPLSSSDVAITWTDNSANEDGFLVERSTDNGGTWTTAIQTSANQARVNDFNRSSESPLLCYRVVAFNSGGDSAPSNTDCTTPPAAPTALTAVAADQVIVLAWIDNSAVEDGYEVQRAPPNGEYAVVANLSANATGFSDSQATVDITYRYYVRAKKDGGFSDQSIPAYGVAVSGPPAPPRAVDAAGSSTTSIDVRWTADFASADGYRVERSTDNEISWISAGTAGGNFRWFSDSGRIAEERVCYRVVAFNSKGNSAPSNVDCTSTTVGPTNLTATNIDSLSIDLAWTDNSTSEDGYVVVRIQYLIQEGWFVIAELPPNSTHYRDADLWFGPSTYTYMVAAKKDGGFSDYSNEAANTSPVALGSISPNANPAKLNTPSAARVKVSTRNRVRQ